MAITNIPSYAHLTDADIEEIGRRMDAIRAEVEATRGERDATYIRRAIALQRWLEVTGRIALFGSHKKPLWLLGATALGLSKIIENLEIGHNAMHGQWDWMNDPEIHSTSWEWDNNTPSRQWKHSHNFVHHTYTNILGMDSDVGYGVLRVTRDRQWTPVHLAQPAVNFILATLFQWAVAFYDVELGKVFAGRKSWEEARPEVMETLRKAGMLMGKDYVLFPALSGPNFTRTLSANVVANLMRNYWAYAVIFCGHFPDETETFTKRQMDNESQGEWYLRQMLGSANFHGGKVLTFMSGNLNYQIEHHLFPDLPSNRLAEVSQEVRKIAQDFDLPYHTGSFPQQFLKVQKTLLKLTLPPSMMLADKDNAPEVRADTAFTNHPEINDHLTVGAVVGGARKGLKTGLKALKKLRKETVERRLKERVGALSPAALAR